MKPLQGIAWLLALQTAGELIGRAFGLPFPGPVIGLLLLLVALRRLKTRYLASKLYQA